MGYYLKRWTRSNVQITRDFPRAVQYCGVSFQPLSETLGFSSCHFITFGFCLLLFLLRNVDVEKMTYDYTAYRDTLG